MNSDVTICRTFGGKIERASNFEALRIVAMSMIIIHHFLVHGSTIAMFDKSQLLWLYHLLDGFTLTGVNLFFLISGYFEIKYSLRSFIKFGLTILTFGIINLILLQLSGVSVKLTWGVSSILFPISGSPYWFIKVYLLMMISAPILNAGLSAMPIKHLRNTLLVLTLVIWYMKGGNASCNYLNGIWLYSIGYYIHHADLPKWITGKRLLMSFIVLCLLCIPVKLLVDKYIPAFSGEFSGYDNIFITISAVSLFCLFQRVNFRSKIVNRIASAALGCYLLQDGKFGFVFLYKWQKNFFETHGILQTFIMFIGCFIAFWIASFLISQFNRLWINHATDKILVMAKNVTTSLSRCLTKQ